MSHHNLFVRDYNLRPRQCQTPHLSRETTISGPNNVRPHTYRVRLQSQDPTMSDSTLFFRDCNIRSQQCQTPHFSCETTISGPDNDRPHAYRARLQHQAPTMSDPTLIARGDYNLRPRQCQTPLFSFETTISGPNNVIPHTFRSRIQYQSSTMLDHTLFVCDYNNTRE